MNIPNEAQAALFKVESIHHIHENQCLCGFKSFVSRDRTKHIMEATLEAAVPHIMATAWQEGHLDAVMKYAPTPSSGVINNPYLSTGADE